MPGMIINTITQLGYVVMYGAIAFFICWILFIYYNRYQESKRMQLGTPDHERNIIFKLAKFGANLGKKIREK